MIEAERAVGLDVHQVVVDLPNVAGRSIRGQAHHLVLRRIHLEAGVIGDSGIQQPEGVREMNLPRDADAGAASDAGRGGGPFADAIHGKNHGLVEGRGIEGAGGVTHVMFGEQ